MPNPQGRIASHLPQFLLQVTGIPGDFAEFGVFEGGVVEALQKVRGDRTVWAFDTFEGIPEEDYDPVLDSCDPPGKWKPNGKYNVPRLLEALDGVKVVKGLFQDTLKHTAVGLLALVHVDCDNYAAHRVVLDWLPAHLSPGAVVAFDDYANCPGAKRAVDEFVAKHGLPLQDRNGKFVTWRPS